MTPQWREREYIDIETFLKSFRSAKFARVVRENSGREYIRVGLEMSPFSFPSMDAFLLLGVFYFGYNDSYYGITFIA